MHASPNTLARYELVQPGLAPSDLNELCPACFERNDGDFERLAMISIDGNFQHRRLRRAAPDSFHEAVTPMFGLGTKTGRDVVCDKSEGVDGCSHFFVAAAEKPRTMKEYDETGLLGVVCRHGHPLRYQNMYQGERFITTYSGLLQVVDAASPDLRWGLMYDVACRFSKWLAREDPILAHKCTVRHLPCIIVGGCVAKKGCPDVA